MLVGDTKSISAVMVGNVDCFNEHVVFGQKTSIVSYVILPTIVVKGSVVRFVYRKIVVHVREG